MKKEVKNVKKANYKLSLIVLGTTLLSISSIGYTINTILENYNSDTFNLNILLEEYGYTKEELSLYESGFVLGEKTSLYTNTYELNTEEEIDEESIYNNLKSVYNGENKEEYINGLESGLEEGKNKAFEIKKNNNVKVRIIKLNN